MQKLQKKVKSYLNATRKMHKKKEALRRHLSRIDAREIENRAKFARETIMPMMEPICEQYGAKIKEVGFYTAFDFHVLVEGAPEQEPVHVFKSVCRVFVNKLENHFWKWGGSQGGCECILLSFHLVKSIEVTLNHGK